MKKEFLEMITEVLLSERLGDELERNAKYKAAIAREETLFESLNSGLSVEQQNMLKDYFDATNATSFIVEGLIYKLGMKDLLSLLKTLSQEGESSVPKIIVEQAAK